MYHVIDYTPEGCTESHKAAISLADGSYIGDIKFAEELRSMGICAFARPGHTVASIGFNSRRKMWYGWSHRAIAGFGVGSKVQKGDCAYVPVDWPDFLEYAISFWEDEAHTSTVARRSTDERGRDCAKVQWEYATDEKLIPNTKLHGTVGGSVMYPPEKWGRGEWTAETLEDAKQMASDFAESVG